MTINHSNYLMNLLTSLRTLILALVLSIGVSYAYAAWAPPTSAPTGGNAEAPVNVGSATQVKAGGLGINGLLDVVGDIQASGDITPGRLCLSGDCKDVWPAGSGSVDWSSINYRPSGLDDGDDVGAQKDPTPMYQCPTAQFLCGGGSGAQAYVGTCFGQLSSVITSCRRVFTGSTGCTYEILPCGLAGYLVQ